MRDRTRRDGICTVAALLFLVAMFAFGVYLPGKKASAKVIQQISAAEDSIREIPVRVAELQMHKRLIAERHEFLRMNHDLVPDDVDLHTVLRQVADLARNCKVSVSRLEPATAPTQESYETLAFHLSFSGDFRGIIAFLNGLERSDRLFKIEELTLSREKAQVKRLTEGEMYFHVYARRDDDSESDENNASLPGSGADTKKR